MWFSSTIYAVTYYFDLFKETQGFCVLKSNHVRQTIHYEGWQVREKVKKKIHNVRGSIGTFVREDKFLFFLGSCTEAENKLPSDMGSVEGEKPTPYS